MEEQEHEEQKPIENWKGEERRRGGGQGNYQGDERRKANAMPTGDGTGGDAGMSEKDAEKEDKD
jgi:hypothetical protein